jgi:hypothetical protein
MLQLLKRVCTFGTDMKCSLMAGNKAKITRKMKGMKIGECTVLDTGYISIG